MSPLTCTESLLGTNAVLGWGWASHIQLLSPWDSQQRGQWTVDKLSAHQEPCWMPSFRFSNLWGLPFEVLASLSAVESGPLYTLPPPNTQIIRIPARLGGQRKSTAAQGCSGSWGLGEVLMYELERYFLGISCLKGNWGCGRCQGRNAITRASRLLGPPYFLFPVFKLPFSFNSPDVALDLLVLTLVITSIPYALICLLPSKPGLTQNPEPLNVPLM